MDENTGKNKRLRQQNEKDIERDKNMRTIGLIGGMSWESTIPYYRIINEEVKKKMGGLHSAKIILYSVEFDEIEKCQSENRWEESGWDWP